MEQWNVNAFTFVLVVIKRISLNLLRGGSVIGHDPRHLPLRHAAAFFISPHRCARLDPAFSFEKESEIYSFVTAA